MSFLSQVKVNYQAPEPKKDSWKNRFASINEWAESNAWDGVEKPNENELKLCVTELFEIINTASAAMRYIEKNDNSKTAAYMADILEGV